MIVNNNMGTEEKPRITLLCDNCGAGIGLENDEDVIRFRAKHENCKFPKNLNLPEI